MSSGDINRRRTRGQARRSRPYPETNSKTSLPVFAHSLTSAWSPNPSVAAQALNLNTGPSGVPALRPSYLSSTLLPFLPKEDRPVPVAGCAPLFRVGTGRPPGLPLPPGGARPRAPTPLCVKCHDKLGPLSHWEPLPEGLVNEN